jgi:hypothetical protein
MGFGGGASEGGTLSGLQVEMKVRQSEGRRNVMPEAVSTVCK